MRYISSQKEGDGEAPIRIVGLCTSLANAKDLGEWIGATSHGLFNFPPGAQQVLLPPSSIWCHAHVLGVGQRLPCSHRPQAAARVESAAPRRTQAAFDVLVFIRGNVIHKQ